MEICVESFDGEKYTVEVGVDDTTADIRRKVATAAELCEDGFDMSFGGKLLAEGDDITQLSAGDTVVLTKTKSQKYDAIAALRDLGETDITAERFEGLTDPKLVHLFLQAEVVTDIPNHFLSGATFEALDLSGVPGVTNIGSSFLQECSALRTVDLSGWSNVTQVERYFLYDSVALHTLDMAGWSNVTQTVDLFLYTCTSLTTLDISGWTNVTQILPRFLSYCTTLRTLDLSGWSKATHTGDFFLCNCVALQTVDLSGWNNVTHLGAFFLSNCSALKTLDLSGWTTVQRIGLHFLYGCKIHTININVSGSSSVVSEYVRNCSLVDDTKRKCVCM